jgi:hypothetical protein
MKTSSYSYIAFLCAALTIVVIAAACGSGVSQGEYDQQAAMLADTETLLVEAKEQVSSLETERDRLIDAGPVKLAAAQLFEDLIAALQSGDGAALYDLVDSGLRGLCTAEDFAGLFDGLEIPAIGAEVDRVYVDVENADRALVTLRATGQLEGELQAAALLLPALPLPIVKEDDAWRLYFPFMDFLESDLFPFRIGDDIPCPTAMGDMAEGMFSDMAFEEAEAYVVRPTTR